MRIRLETTDGQVLTFAAGVIEDSAALPDLTVAVGAGALIPGFINGHDHLYRNHYPRIGAPPYADVYEWGRDIHEHWHDAIARAATLDRRDALLFGALKNVLGGATTVVHHDPWHPALDADFPIRVARVRSVHSLGTEQDFRAALAGSTAPAHAPLCVHVAEGVTQRVKHEVAELARYGALDETLLAVHLIGVDPDGIRALSAAQAAAVWCPTSNQFLYGRTAPRALFDSGIDTLLGTDSLLSGAGTLLDELRAARALGYLDDARLYAAVSSTAARRLRMPAPSLQPGVIADVVLLRRPWFEARSADVAMVLVGGVPLLADEEFAALCDALNSPMSRIAVQGEPKLVSTELARAAQRACNIIPEAARLFT